MRSQGEVGGPASVSSCGCPSPRKITFEIGMLTFGGLEGKDHNSNRKAGILLLDGSLSLGSASCTVSALPSGESRIMECHTIEWTLQKILNGKLLAARPPLIHRSISGPAYVPIPLMWLILGRLTPKCLLCVPYIPGCAKSLQLCLTLYDPMNCSLPDSSIHGILQARILEWVALSPSRGSSPPRDQTRVSYHCISRWVLYHQRHLGSHSTPPRYITLRNTTQERDSRAVMYQKPTIVQNQKRVLFHR